LTRKGVVFNEMKGVYSSPDSLLMEQSQRTLFPDTAYGLDSGGDPQKISQLSYQQFKEFHSRYYHPSNARIYFYGDDDPEERLRIADSYLKEFEKIEVTSEVILQSPVSRPVEQTFMFAAGEGREKGMFTCGWLLAEITDIETVFAFQILEQVLLGMPASPLKRAVIESGLCEDIAGVGLEDELRQMYFSTGMRGVDPADFDKAEQLIRKTLEQLADKGIAGDIVEAACNTVVFRFRENNTGRFPRGLEVMLRSLRTWLYGGDPFGLIAFSGSLDRVLEKIRSNRRYLPNLIRRYLIDNPHRSTVHLQPQSGFEEKRMATENRELAAIFEKFDISERKTIVQETQALLELQQKEDSPEDLAKIPRVGREDLALKGTEVPFSLTERGVAALMTHPLSTGGVVYFDLALSLERISEDKLVWIPIFGGALLGMGTVQRDYADFATWIAGATGGIHASTYVSAAIDGGLVQCLLFRGKALREKKGELIEILQEALTKPRLDNRERFLQIVQERRARMEHSLIPSGHQAVLHRVRASLHPAHAIEERFVGVTQLRFLKELELRVKKDWAGVLSHLEELFVELVQSRGAVFNITADSEDISGCRNAAEVFLDGLPVGGGNRQKRVVGKSKDMLMTIPAQVNYVGRAANLYSCGYQYHGSASVITRFLRTAWLWDQIRVQGGAYGAFSPFNRMTGVMGFVSYRDPNCVKTLEVYQKTGRYLIDLRLSAEDLEKAIVGAIGDIDTYMLPDEKGFVSMKRYLVGDSPEERQCRREEILNTTVTHFQEFGKVLQQAVAEGVSAVLGPEGLKEELRDYGVKALVEKVL